MKNNLYRLRKITMTAVMIAIICVLTIAVRIPSPTKGYMNLGDSAVLFGGWLLGPIYGTIAGGIGSALADLFAGYPVYIPGTLIIKAIMAFILSLGSYFFVGSKKKHPRIRFIVSAVIAEVFMVAGYYLYEAIAIGEGFVTAFSGVVGNTMQGIVGVAGSYFLIELLSRTDVFRLYGANGFTNKGKKNFPKI